MQQCVVAALLELDFQAYPPYLMALLKMQKKAYLKELTKTLNTENHKKQTNSFPNGWSESYASGPLPLGILGENMNYFNLILIGLMLIAKSCFGWYMSDSTPENFWQENTQFNEIRKLPPEGCNDQWWELDDQDIIDFLEKSPKLIYIQDWDEKGNIYWYVIKMNWN